MPNEINPQINSPSDHSFSQGNRSRQDANAYFSVNNKKITGDKPIDNVIDEHWVNSMFMTSNNELSEADARDRFFTTAEVKFGDTSLGGNIGINSRPQFTRYADMRVSGRRTTKSPVRVNNMSGNYGMGRYYSEAIDDNSQTLYIEFGVPEFNSLFSFFTRSIDYATSVIANTGRSPIAYYAGKVLGGIAVFVAFPLASLAIWGLKLLNEFLISDGTFSYYYLKPTMHVYWGTVNTIVTGIATELGILIPEFIKPDSNAKIGVPVKINQDDLDAMRKLLPNVITETNYIDVYAIANRAQVLSHAQILAEREAFENGLIDPKDQRGYVRRKTGVLPTDIKGTTYGDFMNKVLSAATYNKEDKKEVAAEKAKQPVVKNGIPILTNEDEDGRLKKDPADANNLPANITSMASYFDAAARGGGQFAVFKVDYIGSVSESFSNSVTDIPAASMIKQISNKGRSAKFSTAGGNIVGGIGTALSAVKDFAVGALDGITFGASNIIPTLFGGGYLDVPKMWDDSTVSLPQLNFSMQLISPYGNTISQLQNMYIPLAMLMAGSLPLSIGNAGYTSPFICGSFLKGVQHIKLGMITNLSITRGTSNLGFGKNRRPLAVDVSFSITDFSSVMTAPVNSSIFGTFKMAMNEGSLFNQYIATLASRDLRTSRYAVPKLKIKLSRYRMGVSQITSPSFWATRTGEVFGGMLSGAMSDYGVNLQETN